MRRVLATAGHVDHGKSTLVRVLTGRDPDRLAEERRRGLTIELGFAWTSLGEGVDVAFVDVPGHRRFIGTMLSGIGPAPAVVLVVAADQGWQAQTSEHVDAVAALGIRDLLLVVTRSDLADPAATRADALSRLAERGWTDPPSVCVSATTGEGLDELREALVTLATGLPEPDPGAPVRMWVDRAFTIGGAGTVVTGTLGDGRLAVGDELTLLDPDVGTREVTVRGLQSQDQDQRQVTGVSRTAINLRRVDTEEVGRGAVLLTPAAWALGRTIDVAVDASDLPDEVTLHVGSADLPATVRPLGPTHARVRTQAELPWRVGDRLILRDPGSRRLWGARVADVEPLPLRRRGAAAARGEALSSGDLRAVRLAEHRVQRAADLARLGLTSSGAEEVPVAGGLVAAPAAWATWRQGLRRLVEVRVTSDPLSAGVPVAEVADRIEVPEVLVPALAAAESLSITNGRVHGEEAGLGTAEAAVAELERRLTASPFAAPERDDLTALGLGAKELAAAQRLGRLLRLPDDVVLLPDGPARAMRELAALDQPFTLSQARQALGTTRRVAVPLLEHLDGRGWTRRVDGQLREVAR
jgi:selenocysteine-specific elongation factor